MPALTNDEAWDRRATPETLQTVVTQTILLVAPETDERRVDAITRFLASEGYTEAELVYAARELPKDEHLDAKLRYGKPLTPADFERVIKQARRLRANLKTEMSREEMIEIVEMHDELTEDDFGQRQNKSNETTYLLKKEARTRLFN